MSPDQAPLWEEELEVGHYDPSAVLDPRQLREARTCQWCGQVSRWIWAPVAQVWLCNVVGCGLGQGILAAPAPDDPGLPTGPL